MIVDAGTARPSAASRVDVLAFLRRLDWLLLLAVATLVAYGLWAVAGITRNDVEGDESYYVARQGIAAAVGVIGLIAAVAIDPAVYRRSWRAIYVGTVGLMVLVFGLAEATRGSNICPAWTKTSILSAARRTASRIAIGS